MTGTTRPPTMVVPLRFGTSGLPTCATSCAYSGAARHTTTIRRNRTRAAIAMRLDRSRRQASAHGLRLATAGRNAVDVVCSATAAMPCSPRGPGRRPGPRGLLREPQLVDQDVPLRVPLVPIHVLGQEVDLLRVVQVDPGRLLGVLVVHLRPQGGCLRRVGGLDGLSLVDLRLDGRVAERGDVRAGVAVLVDGAAAEQDVEEVRRGRVVLVPG